MVFTLNMRRTAVVCSSLSGGSIYRSSGIACFVQGGVVKTFRCRTLLHEMNDPNPYQSPEASPHSNKQGDRAVRKFNSHHFIVLAALLGLTIGLIIFIARWLVEGFYIVDFLRDTVVGIIVGAAIGVVWSLYRFVRHQQTSTE